MSTVLPCASTLSTTFATALPNFSRPEMSFGASAITASSARRPSSASAISMSAITMGPRRATIFPASAPSASSFAFASCSSAWNICDNDMHFLLWGFVGEKTSGIRRRERAYFDLRAVERGACDVALGIDRGFPRSSDAREHIAYELDDVVGDFRALCLDAEAGRAESQEHQHPVDRSGHMDFGDPAVVQTPHNAKRNAHSDERVGLLSFGQRNELHDFSPLVVMR